MSRQQKPSNSRIETLLRGASVSALFHVRVKGDFGSLFQREISKFEIVAWDTSGQFVIRSLLSVTQVKSRLSRAMRVSRDGVTMQGDLQVEQIAL